MKRLLMATTIVLCLTSYASADKLEKLADEIRPKASEQRWRTIPWCSTPEEALKQAREENRPILVWVTAGDPFGRC